jgi:hypothetical protein
MVPMQGAEYEPGDALGLICGRHVHRRPRTPTIMGTNPLVR